MAGPSSLRRVQLLDARDPERKLVSSELYRDYPPSELDVVEAQWAAARQLTAATAPTEHSHWDWRNKAHSVEAGLQMLVAVECRGEVQGMMAVLQAPRRSRSTGEPILYVDYVESAPWNLKHPAASPRFLGVGIVLIGEAVRLSLDMGLEGRIGLHSLPQAEAFYRVRCGMTEFGQDDQYFDLTYFEFGRQQAAQWLASTGGTG